MIELKYFFISLVGILFFSCQNDKIELLHKDIIKIHDEVMPKSMEISELYLDFRKKIQIDTTLSAQEIDALNKQADRLEKVEDEMMIWMSEYMPPQKLQSSKNEKEIENYLLEQKKAIEKIKILTNENLETAKKFKNEIFLKN